MLSLSTPGSCCGHNLDVHSGSGLEAICLVCSCDGFIPDLEGKLAIGPRRCEARHAQKMYLRCQGEVTEQTVHVDDHSAIDRDGQTLRWTELVAVYPAVGGSARDSQVGGEHYKKFKIQPWDIWQEYGLDAFTGAILKYLLRDKGNRLEDLKKARHTLDRLIEIEEQREA